MDFSKIDEEWSRMSFSLEPDSPDELRIDMFVKLSAKSTEGKRLYDIGWAKEFTGPNSCSFKTLEQVANETGLDFRALGLQGDMGEMYFLHGIPQRDVVYFHTISRFWAMRNGLLQKIRDTQEELSAPVPAEGEGSERTEYLEKKIKKLEKMTNKLMKQNVTIYKTIKSQAPKSFLSQLLSMHKGE